MSRPIRVLHLRDSPWVDGPGRTIIESGRHFDSTRIQYHIGVFVQHANDEHPMLAAAQQHNLSVHRIVDRGGIDPHAVRQIIDLVDRLKIQILHTSDLRSRLYGLLVGLRRPSLARITTVHGWIANTGRRRLLRFIDKILLRNSRTVVNVSEATRSLVPSWWLPGSRTVVLRNALVVEEYGSNVRAGRRDDRRLNHRTRVLNVGRLSAEKGQEIVINAVAELATELPDLRLLIAGIGPREAELRDLAIRLGIEGRVEFLGYVEDMPSLYSSVDVVVQSSFTEGLPNVILEAAYLGIPIIATDVGGTSEVIEHGHSGWLVSPGSISAVVNALRYLSKRPEDFVRMAGRARQRIEQRFSFSARTSRMMHIYEDLVE